MALVDLARSHVKECLREGLELSQVKVDADGDIPFRNGTAAYWVSVRSDGQFVKAWSRAVTGVKPTVAVLREVNEVNMGLELSRMWVQHGTVSIEGVLPVEGLTPEQLRELCFEVGNVADEVGQMISTVHGGSVWFSDDECDHCGS